MELCAPSVFKDFMERERNNANIPVTPLPNPGEGGPVANPDNIPVTPLPNPGEGGPVNTPENTPVIPLPNPGEGGPVVTPDDEAGIPIIPLPNPGEGGPIANPGINGNITVIPIPLPNTGGSGTIITNWPSSATVRFLNAAYGYQPFRIFVNNRRAVNFLGYASISTYGRFLSGFQTVTVTGIDGYVYIQKTLPFEAGSKSTVAVINRPGGLDIIQIQDTCCAPNNSTSNFRVSNLAYNSGPIDVLLGDGRVIYADVNFKETTEYKRIQPGEYQFIFAQTNLMPMPDYLDIESLDSAFIGMYPLPETVASLYINIQPNANYTVFLLNNGPSGDSLQTLVVEDK